MTDRTSALSEDAMKFGLLMESAQAHQQMAEAHLAKLRAHTRDLDVVVRDEIRRTLEEELKAVAQETERAADALRAMRGAATMRGLVMNLATAGLCMAMAGAFSRWVLPSKSEIEALRLERDALTLNLARLRQLGGKVDWHHCGDDARLCVRIDRTAPLYGEHSDFLVVKGY
jgi:hypothetical protein